MTLDEVSTKSGSIGVVVVPGRFQPPTVAHTNITREAYIRTGLPVVIVIVGDSKTDRSPFAKETTEKMFALALEGDVPYSIIHTKTAFFGEFVHELRNRDMEPLELWCGSDRAETYRKQLQRYEELFKLDLFIFEYSRNHISATQVRQSLQADDENAFKKLVDPLCYTMYDELRKELLSDVVQVPVKHPTQSLPVM